MSVAFGRGIGEGRGIMRRPLSLVLILCIALTGIGLGAARGTVVRDGRVVICTGRGVVVVDHPGAPAQRHLCPDMALSLLVATPVPPTDYGPSVTAARSAPHPQPLGAQGRLSPAPAARGPPAVQRSALKPA